jgi:hypothetical protein
MSYVLGAWYDPLVSAARSAVSSTVSSAAQSAAAGAAAGAAPELKSAVVGAVREVLPDVKNTLSSALSDGFSAITKKNQAVFVGFGVALGFFTIGSLVLMYAQYRRLGKCCPLPALPKGA